MSLGPVTEKALAAQQRTSVDEAADPAPEVGFIAVFADDLAEFVDLLGLLLAELLSFGPVIEAPDGDVARVNPINDVVQRIGGIVRPVHDLALDALKGVEGLRALQLGRGLRVAEYGLPPPGLIVIDEVVLRGSACGLLVLGVKGLVFHHSVEESTGGGNPPGAPGAFVDQLGQDAQGLTVALESAVGGHQLVEFALADMAEGRMPEVVGQADGLGQVRIDVKVALQECGTHLKVFADRAPNLSHLNRVGQPGAVEVVFSGLEDLCFRLEAPKGVGENDAVALDFKSTTVFAGVWLAAFRKTFQVEFVIETVLHVLRTCRRLLVSLETIFISIMKYPAFFSLFLVACLMQPQSGEARIGERREALERRLFASGGILYRAEGESKSRRQGGPYSSYMKYLGNSAEVRVYFKTDDGRQPSRSEVAKNSLGSGWELHVLYVNGKSVLELYKRVGSRASEYEINALLAILGGSAYWKEADAGKRQPASPSVESDTESGEEEEPPRSAFGFDYLRNDGEVRAKKSGGGIMVFQKQLDEFLARQHESSLQKEAPESVQGF